MSLILLKKPNQAPLPDFMVALDEQYKKCKVWLQKKYKFPAAICRNQALICRPK